METVLNRTSATRILRFLSLCLKRGVLDAASLQDSFEAQSFYDAHWDKWDFALIGEPDDFDWKMFRFEMYKMCRRSGLSLFAEQYLYQIRTQDYLFCPLIFAMRFYLMGVKEWLDYPNTARLDIYRLEKTPMHFIGDSHNARSMKRVDILANMQDTAYKYRRWATDRTKPTGNTMVEFVSALFTMTAHPK